MRSKILIGNWKMNMLSSDAIKFAAGVEASVLNAKKHKYSGRIETNIENFFVTKSFLCNFAT